MMIINKITNLVAAAIGMIEMALPIIKEAIVTLTRVSTLIFFWTDIDEKIIEKINAVYEVIIDYFEKFKNLWLAFGRR